GVWEGWGGGGEEGEPGRPVGRGELAGGGETPEPLVVVPEVEIRTERTRHEWAALVDRRPAQVAEPQVEPFRDAGFPRPLGADSEHPRGGIDADHMSARERGRNGDPTGADAELHDLATRRERLVDVERDVLDDACTPRVVERRDGVVDVQGLRVT